MIGAALAALLLATPAQPAEPVRDRDIPVAEGFRVYNLPTAEVVAAQGFTGVRVFFTNAQGFHQPAVAVLRKGEAAPQVFAWTKGQTAGIRIMGGEIDRWGWRTTQLLMDEVRAAPEIQPESGFEWPEPQPPSPKDGEEAEEVSEYFCTDSSSVMIEVIEGGRVTRRERQSCPADLAFNGAASLLSLAADSIDGCSAIELDGPNRPVTRLYNCSILMGPDHRADADLLNALNRTRLGEAGQEGRVVEVLDPSARLLVFGSPLRRGVAGIADWYVAEAARHKEPGLQTDTVFVAGDTGYVIGGLFYKDEDNDHYFWARSGQTWRRVGEDWRIVLWTVGAWSRETFKD